MQFHKCQKKTQNRAKYKKKKQTQKNPKKQKQNKTKKNKTKTKKKLFIQNAIEKWKEYSFEQIWINVYIEI